jgi:hypothetical protein
MALWSLEQIANSLCPANLTLHERVENASRPFWGTVTNRVPDWLAPPQQ